MKREKVNTVFKILDSDSGWNKPNIQCSERSDQTYQQSTFARALHSDLPTVQTIFTIWLIITQAKSKPPVDYLSTPLNIVHKFRIVQEKWVLESGLFRSSGF